MPINAVCAVFFAHKKRSFVIPKKELLTTFKKIRLHLKFNQIDITIKYTN